MVLFVGSLTVCFKKWNILKISHTESDIIHLLWNGCLYKIISRLSVLISPTLKKKIGIKKWRKESELFFFKPSLFLKNPQNVFVYLCLAVGSSLLLSVSVVVLSGDSSLVALWGLLIAMASLAAEHQLWAHRFQWLKRLDSRAQHSITVMHGLSRSSACGIFLDQGLNSCLRHWQAYSSPLSHQEAQKMIF